ncbi:MAG: hypothetical protein D6E12_17170 [Desulfovibrio sp.]|nr:MAG: hypothetical protein D6E12_17170 [Desulfovibrio sp.]
MEETKYILIFSGKMAADSDPNEVAAKIQELFQVDPLGLKRVMSQGGSIKTPPLNREDCWICAKAFREAGALCQVIRTGNGELPQQIQLQSSPSWELAAAPYSPDIKGTVIRLTNPHVLDLPLLVTPRIPRSRKEAIRALCKLDPRAAVLAVLDFRVKKSGSCIAFTPGGMALHTNTHGAVFFSFKDFYWMGFSPKGGDLIQTGHEHSFSLPQELRPRTLSLLNGLKLFVHETETDQDMGTARLILSCHRCGAMKCESQTTNGSQTEDNENLFHHMIPPPLRENDPHTVGELRHLCRECGLEWQSTFNRKDPDQDLSGPGLVMGTLSVQSPLPVEEESLPLGDVKTMSFEENEPESELETYRQALKVNENDNQALLDLALALRAKDQVKEYRRYLGKALENGFPDAVEHVRALAKEAKHMLAAHEFEKAMAAFEDLMFFEPDNGDHYYNGAVLGRAMGLKKWKALAKKAAKFGRPDVMEELDLNL